MGKASRWFRNLLGLTKKPDSTSLHRQPPSATGKEKTRWSFFKSYSKKQHPAYQFTQLNSNLDQRETASFNNDPSKHAIAMAAATAEATVAAARAGAEVVRLTSEVGNSTVEYVTGMKDDEHWAAVKIQSAFRGHLARRARRALKGLVKMQALVRGHIERKRIEGWMHQTLVLMRALLRAQAQARAQQSQISESSLSSSKSSHFQHIGPTILEKDEHGVRAQNSKQVHLPRKYKRKHNIQSYRCSFSDPISHGTSNSKDSIAREIVPSPSSKEVQSLSPLKFSEDQAEDDAQFFSASSRGGSSQRSPFTPTKCNGSRSYLSGCLYHPSYMDHTKSSQAKVRSLNAHKACKYGKENKA